MWIAAGALLLVRWDIAQRREVFQTEARSAHRLLSQRMAQHEAILSTLALARPAAAPSTPQALLLPAAYPQLLRAQVQSLGAGAPCAATPGVHLGRVQPDQGRYTLLLRTAQTCYEMQVAARQLWRADEWPLAAPTTAPSLPAQAAQPPLTPQTAGQPPVAEAPASAPASAGLRLLPGTAGVQVGNGPHRVQLRIGPQTLLLQAGADPGLRPAGLTEGFRFTQTLASDSQPFELQVQRWTGPAEWPWALLGLFALASVATSWAGQRLLAASEERRRSAELLRLARVGRLSALGELAAGMAHELNQPLTAVVSGTQAALRLLRDEQEWPGEGDGLAAAIPALELATAQARRAADVVERLRNQVRQAPMGAPAARVDLAAVVQRLLQWLEPELRTRGVQAQLSGSAPAARADPVAVEQILHNLLMNALQALDHAPAAHRRVQVRLDNPAGQVRCVVQDNGPGIAAKDLLRVFEPFFTTRADGLGLGLPLCQTLAQAMGGRLDASSTPGAGATFTLTLPAADTLGTAAEPPAP